MAFWSTRHWQHKLILGSNLFKLQICSQGCWGIYVQTIVHWETKHHPRHPRVMLNDVGVCFFSRKRSSKPCARFGVSWLKRPLKTRPPPAAPEQKSNRPFPTWHVFPVAPGTVWFTGFPLEPHPLHAWVLIWPEKGKPRFWSLCKQPVTNT